MVAQPFLSPEWLLLFFLPTTIFSLVFRLEWGVNWKQKKNNESQKTPSRKCPFTIIEKANLGLYKPWRKTQNQTACETANRVEGEEKGKCMANPHEVSQTAFVCTEMVLWDSLQKKGTKKLRSWVQKIKLHFHWSQTCKSCLINHSCLKIPINGLKCWGCPYGSSL